MKQFVLKAVILTVIAFVISNVLMFSYLFTVEDRVSLYSHEKNVALAYSRLESLADSTKLVIIAGSNGGFSINSRMLSHAFGLPVVNTSTHAGIGVRMQFELYKSFLRKGDIVVFCPEYDSEESRLYGGSVLLRILSTHIPSAYSKISFTQWLYLYKYIGVHYVECQEHRIYPEFDGPYSAKVLNEYGDIECERLHQDTIEPYRLSGTVSSLVFDYYRYMRDYAEANGITFVFLPPTLIESGFSQYSLQIDSIADYLERNYSFPDSLYFDTPYHMTTTGADKRTEVLIEDLRRILGQRSRV